MGTSRGQPYFCLSSYGLLNLISNPMCTDLSLSLSYMDTSICFQLTSDCLTLFVSVT